MSELRHTKSLRTRWKDMVCLLALVLAVAAFFVTSPTAGDFWWSDAPRHAMDGVFYHDMARALPFAHLKQWAIDYYLQYPAVTALTYPPLFALVEAIFFGIFGISHSTAQLTVTFFLLLAAWGAYVIARRWLNEVAALATALVFIGTPVMALWSRQVMLEIPTFALLLWGAYFFFKYLDSGKPYYLYLTFLLVLAAAYTKQPAIFIVPAYVLTLCAVHKKNAVRRAELWWSALLLLVGIIPLAFYTWMWGRTNMQQAVGGGWVKHSRLSAATWSYVASYEWPRQVGWMVLALAVVYCVGCLIRQRWRLPHPALLFFLLWLTTGYIFFTLIAVSSQRYTIFLIFPLALFAVLGVMRLVPGRAASYLCLTFGIATVCYTLAKYPAPYVSGYRTAAELTCSVAPADSVVMFSGLRDGSFIFNVRSLPQCKNLTVIRADKLLLKVAVDRQLFGVQEFGITEAHFKEMLERYGIRYIVIEPDFWSDLKSMQMLVGLVRQDQFKLLARIPIQSNRDKSHSQIEIYENLGPLSQGRNLLRVELPVSGISVEGSVGQQENR